MSWKQEWEDLQELSKIGEWIASHCENPSHEKIIISKIAQELQAISKKSSVVSQLM